MKKLIKADLSGILRLTGAYQAVEAPDVEREVAILQSSRYTDYFFWPGRGAAACPPCPPSMSRTPRQSGLAGLPERHTMAGGCPLSPHG